VVLPKLHPLVTGLTSDSALVQAYHGSRPEKLPVWFMRQAGRSLPEYRKIREGVSMLESCLNPAIATEITLQPVRRHKVDAAIFFSDIVIPLKLAELEVEIVSGIGPVISDPIQRLDDLNKLPSADSIDFSAIERAVSLTTSQLEKTPLIGFCGAPFTLASYLIEGGPSKDLPVTKAIMENDPILWNKILTWVAQISAKFLEIQILSGASAIQVFDSWAGKLTPAEYEKFAAPYTKELFIGISHLPVSKVHFGLGTKAILKTMHQVGATVMGIDYLTSLKDAVQILGDQVPLQGNIDPKKLLADFDALKIHVSQIIEDGKLAKSHILNLGHGVIPETDPDVITELVQFIHENK
jgi:uroporphyrinogen decarboxylase